MARCNLVITMTDITDFFRSQVPSGWFTGPVDVDRDDDEILCTGDLPDGTNVKEFRERSRAERVAIAAAAEKRFGRKVSWGVREGGRPVFFTSLSTPVMTRLRLRERAVLDTLVEAGVARSRSEALAWCVRLVGQHQEDWLVDLRDALVGVQRARADGPTLI
jgi:hypothetical protein